MYVYVEKFCVSKLCDDKLCVNSCGHKRRREEEADGGIQNQKQEPHTKMWGKTLTFCSLLTRCTIPCVCHEKPHLTSKSGPRV